MIPILAITMKDALLESVRRNLAEAVRELQQQPLARAKLIANVQLADGVETPIPHGLARPVVWVRESCVRGALSAGYVLEVRSSNAVERAQYVTLKAVGYGATITVDLVVL